MAIRWGQVFGLLLLGCACEGPPARSKDWRHAPEPGATPAVSQSPAVAARTNARAEKLAKRARTLTIRLEAEPSHLSPFGDPERESNAVLDSTIFETLVTRDELGNVKPRLAESFRVAVGGSELRFVLRENVRFHDGQPLTATDVKASVDRLRGPSSRNPILRALLADVVSAEVWGPRDFRLVLARPSGWALRALAALPIAPAHVYGGGETAKARQPIGSGPYRLAAWERGKRIVLERWDGYWGAKPAIPEIAYVVEPDGAQALVMATRGDLDVIPVLPPSYAKLPNLASAPSLQPLRLRPPRVRFLALNSGRPPFDDVRVREAVSLLVDRRKLSHEVLRDEWEPIAAPAWPGGPLDIDAVPVPPYDPVRAALLLEQAGWTDFDGDRVRSRGPERLHVALLSTAGERDPGERELVAQALRQAGFVVEVRPGDPGYLAGRIKAGDFDVALVEWRGLGDADLCSLFGPAWGSIRARSLDAACDALAAAPDAAARHAVAASLVRALGTEWPLVPTVAWDPRGVASRRVKNLHPRDGWFDPTKLELAE
jgi:peptide/nickel transport system substrate-binding protein